MSGVRPNLSGRWKADLTKARPVSGAPTDILLNVEHTETMLATEMHFTSPNGTIHSVAFKGEIGGKQVENVVNGTVWRSTLVWIGDELLIETRVQQPRRDFHFRDFWSLSADGQVLTMAHRDDDLAGQVSVLNKIG